MDDDLEEMRQTIDQLLIRASAPEYDTLKYVLGMAALEIAELQDRFIEEHKDRS